jgi:cytochrome c oxidase subunit 2
MRRCAAVAFLALAGCTARSSSPMRRSPSIFDAQGPQASRLAFIGWLMISIGGAAFLVVLGTLLFGLRRRKEDKAVDPRRERRIIVAGGVVFPLVVALVLMGYTIRASEQAVSLAGPGDLEVDVIGHQFFWEVSYPALGIVTANEIHVPVGKPVQVALTSDDVIHSFWVPQLAGKIDMIPGHTNRLGIRADRAGVYRGQCAEYCGIQHAKMAFLVVADPEERFERWAAREREASAGPSDEVARRGLDVFLSNACVTCHTIRGTEATGRLGPDLTHFGNRMTLGAGEARNFRENLAAWIADSQSIKPGNRMPPMSLSPEDLRAVVAYLESLQ